MYILCYRCCCSCKSCCFVADPSGPCCSQSTALSWGLWSCFLCFTCVLQLWLLSCLNKLSQLPPLLLSKTPGQTNIILVIDCSCSKGSLCSPCCSCRKGSQIWDICCALNLHCCLAMLAQRLNAMTLRSVKLAACAHAHAQQVKVCINPKGFERPQVQADCSGYQCRVKSTLLDTRKGQIREQLGPFGNQNF